MLSTEMAATFAETGQSAPPPSYSQVILAVIVNGLAGDLGTVFQQDRDGHLFAAASVLADLNLRPSEFSVRSADGLVLFDLSRIDGLSYRLNPERAELAITAAPEAFLSTHINIGSAAAQNVASYLPGGFLNYDLSMTKSPVLRTDQGLFELGMFRGEGLLTSSFTAGSLANARLMTTYQNDRVDEIKTLRLGDSYNATGAWGQGVLFGGFQYGTNFAIRPDFIASAMPSLTGKALLPSTVNVYLDNVLRTTQNVAAGPFSIQNLPAVTGAGTMQIVVTDLLGREQVVSQPFFAAPTLLRAGLVQDSYEFGLLRANYGLASNDYRDPFAAVTYREGLSDQTTAEGRVELQKDLAAAGLTVIMAVPAIDSVVQATGAASAGSGLSPGVMGSLTFSYIGRHWSANLRTQLDSPHFRQLGSNLADLPRQIDSAQLSAPIGDGTLSVSYLRNLSTGSALAQGGALIQGDNVYQGASFVPTVNPSQGSAAGQGETRTSIVNLGFSQPISEDLFASFSALRSLASGRGTTVGLVVTMLFDSDHFGSATVSRQAATPSLYSQYQQSTPRDEGTGYRLAVLNEGDASRQEGSVMRNQSFGSYQLDLVRQNGAVNARLSAQGGIDLIDDGLFFSRGLNQSFAVVRTGTIEGVPISLENQVMAHTDADGRAILSNLLPYQNNRISIDPLSLPLEASVSDVEKVVVPRAQGGVLVDFGVRIAHNVSLTLWQADGTPLPPWTPVEVVGAEGMFVTGNRGEVSVELPNLIGNHVIARPLGGRMCELFVDLPDVRVMPPQRGLTCAPGL